MACRERFYPASSWVYAVFLTCDNHLGVQFKSHHGGPGVTCIYPGVPGRTYYAMMKSWFSKGKFVWWVLPYKQPYVFGVPPDE
jgi:hypothetical protein